MIPCKISLCKDLSIMSSSSSIAVYWLLIYQTFIEYVFKSSSHCAKNWPWGNIIFALPPLQAAYENQWNDMLSYTNTYRCNECVPKQGRDRFKTDLQFTFYCPQLICKSKLYFTNILEGITIICILYFVTVLFCFVDCCIS